MRRHFLILFFIFSFPPTAFAQQWTRYTVADGLPPGRIYTIYEDREGNLWFGTDNGACRFDGFRFRTFTADDGLSLKGDREGNVYAILQANTGHLWFGTSAGVSRFDGKRFQNFSVKDGLAYNGVNVIYADSKGNLWFGTGQYRWGGGNGISRWDGTSFQTFTFNELGFPAAHDERHVFHIAEDSQGTLWIATSEGLSRYDGRSFQTYVVSGVPRQNRVTAIYKDKSGYLWLGDNAGYIYKTKEERKEGSKEGGQKEEGKEERKEGRQKRVSDGIVRAILQDRSGNFWFATEEGVFSFQFSVFSFQREKTRRHRDTENFGNQKSKILRVSVPLWFSSISQNLKLTTENGLPHNSVYSICQDSAGNLWFGTEDGAARYDDMSFQNYTEQEGLTSRDVRAIHRDSRGRLWVLNGNAISQFNGKDFQTIKSGTAYEGLSSIYEDRSGNLWFGKTGWYVKYDVSKTWQVLKSSLNKSPTSDSDSPLTVFEDSHGRVWFLPGRYGVDYYESQAGMPVPLLTLDLPGCEKEIVTISEDVEGNLWFGTLGNGVWKWKGGQEFRNYTETDGLADNNVNWILKDKTGSLWFATENGVSQYEPQGDTFRSFNIKHGLGHNRVHYIYQGGEEREGRKEGGQKEEGKEGRERGGLWFCTRWGITHYNGQRFQTITSYADGLGYDIVRAYPDITKSIMEDNAGNLWFIASGITKYDGTCYQALSSKDGLASNGVRAMVEDQDGHLWIATNNGITRHIPDKAPPRATIVSVIADRKYRPTGTIQLPPSVKRVTFAYQGSDFRTRPGQMWYLYQLEGADVGWRKPIRQEQVDYLYLKPGRYTFRVKAADRDLNYSQPASVEITVLTPPFYTSARFIVSTIFAAFFIPTAVYFILLTRQKRRPVFQPIPNPYVVGNPIRTKEMFFGREDDFQFIHDKLVGSTTGLIIVLAGERRSGKTSILYQILNGRLGPRFVPVFMDIQAMTVRDDAEFFFSIARETAKAVAQASLPVIPSLEDYNFRNRAHPAQTFSQYVDALVPTLGERTLLYLFDEYELLEAKVTDGTLTGESLTFLAGLLERHFRIAFLFVGSRHIEERTAPFWEVLLAKSIARHISFLSQQDTYRLIQEPVSGQVQYARNVPEAIYRLTAGQPFYTQVVCQNLIDRLNIEERSVAEQEDIIIIARELEENPLPQMLYLWDSFTREQQWMLSILAELQSRPDQAVHVSEIHRSASTWRLPVSLTEADWRGILEGLCRREIIQRVSDKGEYRYRIDFFRPWVRHQHSIWEAQG